jgi:hypothetical protein
MPLRYLNPNYLQKARRDNADDVTFVVVPEKENGWFHDWLELCVVVNDRVVVKAVLGVIEGVCWTA